VSVNTVNSVSTFIIVFDKPRDSRYKKLPKLLKENLTGEHDMNLE